MTTIKQTIVDLFELDKMAPEKAAEMVDRLGKLVFQAVLVRALPLLSEENFTEYEKIIESLTEEVFYKNTFLTHVLFKFLSEKVPGFENMITEESEALRAELAGEFSSANI